MRSFHNHLLQVGASYLSIGVLTVGSLTAGQSTSPQTQASNQQGTSSSGWKRVGNSTDQSTPASSQTAYLPPQAAPPSGPENGQNQPMDQDPASPAGAMQTQGPAPNGQGGYGQGPYMQPGYQQQQGYGPIEAPNGQGQPNYGPVQQQPPQAPVPSQLSMAAGTFITVRVNQFLTSDRNQQGDAFSASLIQPLVANGVVIAEPGQTIGGRVVESQKAGRVEGTSRLRVQLTELSLVDGQQVPIQTQLIDRKGNTSVGRDAAGIAGTTGLGAAIGAGVGWGTGAAIGAGAGAAVGVLGVLLTRGQPTVIAPEQALTFRLEAPVTIYTDRAPQAFRYVQPNEYDRPSYSQAPYPQQGAPQYAAAPYAAPYPYYGGGYGYGGYYGYPYSPFYYGPSFSLFLGSRYYGHPYYYGRPGGYYGRFSYGRGGRR